MSILAVLDPAAFRWNAYGVLPVLTTLTSFSLGGVVILREQRSRIAVSFLILALSVGMWLLTFLATYFVGDYAVALSLHKAVYLAVPLIPAAAYQFSVSLLGIRHRRLWWTRLHWAIGASFALIILTTDALISNLYRYPWGYYPRYNWLGGPFLVWFVVTMLSPLAEFWLAYQQTTPGTIYHSRLRAFVIAFAVGSLGMIDLLPTVGVAIYPYGFVFVLSFLVIVARTIHRYRLVEITPAVAASQIIETMTDSLIVLDRDGTIRLVNRATLALLNQTERDLIGRPVEQTIAGSFLTPVVLALREGAPIQNREVAFCERTLSLSASVLYGQDGVLTMVCVARDVTERVRQERQICQQAVELRDAYEKLQRTQTQVIQQERLYALGTMASGIVHDFKNALTPILGYAEILLENQDRVRNPVTLRNHLTLIKEAATDAAEIVDRLRDFYRPTAPAGTFVAVDLNALITRTIALTRPRWYDPALPKGKRIALTHDLQSIPLVRGNPGELREILTNLIFNAVDAMPEGGQIQIRTRAAGDGVVIEVSDSGVGMSEEVRQKCLEPFFTTKGEKGNGIGLSVVYGSVRRHEGTIEIESTVGQGTIFRIVLPEQPCEASQATAGPPEERLGTFDPSVEETSSVNGSG